MGVFAIGLPKSRRAYFLFFALITLLSSGRKLIARSNSFHSQWPFANLQIQHFSQDDGLPTAGALSIHQSKSGYIWITTFSGLIRFDGIKMEVFNKKKLPWLNNNVFTEIFETKDGTLYFGGYNGLLIRKEGEWKLLSKESGLPGNVVSAIAQGRDGTIWLGTNNGLCFVSPNDSIVSLSTHRILSQAKIYDIAAQGSTMWVTTKKFGVFEINKNGTRRHFAKEALHKEFRHILSYPEEGRIRLSTDSGHRDLFPEGRFEDIGKADGLPGNRSKSFYHDSKGRLWVGTDTGLCIATENGYSTPLKLKGISHYQVVDITEDREGNIWVATYRNGFFYLKESQFYFLGKDHGLSGEVVYCIVPLNKSSKLIGTNNGVDILKGNQLRPFLAKDALPSGVVRDILIDSKRNIWVCTESGLARFSEDGKPLPILSENKTTCSYVRLAIEDSDGKIWLGTREGINVYDGKQFRLISKKDGLKSDYILGMMEDSKGQIWVSTQSGLSIIKDGKVTKTLTKKDGLAGDVCFRPYEDTDSIIWVGANGGLSRIDGDSIMHFSSQDGLASDEAFQIIEDNGRHFWVICNEGAYQICRDSIDALVEGRDSRIESLLLDRNLGLHGGTPNSKSYKDKKGYIWLCTQKGIAKLSLKSMSQRGIAPKVIISDLTLDDTQLSPEKDDFVKIKPYGNRLEISFTGIHFEAPQHLRFQYKLEGFDPKWQTAKSLRKAVYTHLPPGEYTFKVKAICYKGIESRGTAKIKVVKEPRFYQSLIIQLLFGLSIILLALLIYRWRLSVLRNRNAMLKTLIFEKTRELRKKSEKLEEQTADLTKMSSTLKKQNEDITAGIYYAQTIQSAILPPTEKIMERLPEFFVYFNPRDIVSGDFYWFHTTPNKTFIVAADCTGHGVPGAFMSLIGSMALDNAVIKNELSDAASILTTVDGYVRQALKQEQTRNHDGMDIAMCILDHENKKLNYAGAKRPLVYVDQDDNSQPQLHTIKGCRDSIGGSFDTSPLNFKNHYVELHKKTSFYIFSDGYQDQFGGVFGKKFMSKQFTQSLLDIQHFSMKEQKSLLHKKISDWQGKTPQVDDMLIVGFQLDPDEIQLPEVKHIGEGIPMYQ
ncbi:guanylate cyclase [Fulvitalea axinellae]|uniref:Guanylate cyclase n=1 Tax=Fulvitalea axinellae TaxID=1182444 RepID=A0AAU9DHM9_9BACT|nr:guanylate cyclase [Fulvitalea axinellae]